MNKNQKEIFESTYKDLSYELTNYRAGVKYVEVRVSLFYKGKEVIIYIYFPGMLCDNCDDFETRARIFIEKVYLNGELKKYCEDYLKHIPYEFDTPFYIEDETFVPSSKKRKADAAYEKYLKDQEELTKKFKEEMKDTPRNFEYESGEKIINKLNKNKKNKSLENQGGDYENNGGGKKRFVIPLVIVSCLAAGGISGAVYHAINRGGGSSPTPTPTPTPTVETVIIHFDAGEGYIDNKTHSFSTKVNKSTTWKDVSKPKDPTCEGHVFSGWNISDASIKEDYKFEADTTINAKYLTNKFTITVDPGEGAFKGGSKTPKTKEIEYGTKWSSIASEFEMEPTVDSKDFSCFESGKTGDVVVKDTTFKESETITAKYVLKGSIAITIDPNDGTVLGSEDPINVTAPLGVTFSEFNEKNRYSTKPKDGKEFISEYKETGYEYTLKDGSKGKVLNTTVIDASFNGATFKAQTDWIAANNFATDSWATIAHEASKTEAEIIADYKVSALSDLIGFKRTLLINTKEYYVTLIDVKHDTYNDGTSDKTAMFTFQFNDLVDDGVIYSYSSTISSESHHYGNSKLNDYLNNANIGLINKLPTALIDNIKPVVKKTFKKVEDSVDVYEETKDKLFVPSLRELNVTSIIRDKAYDTKVEGEPYNYYTTHTDLTKNYNSTPTAYWVRSPRFLNEGDGAVWGIDKDGQPGFTLEGYDYRQPEDVLMGMGVSVAFAI